MNSNIDLIKGNFDLVDKWHFRTIGMGTINYRAASKRLAKEVFDTGLFSTSIGFTESFFKTKKSNFWENHKSDLKAYIPGFGWWIWKPEFIKICLKSIPEGDGLMYLDSGSFVGNNEKDLIQIVEDLNLASIEEIIGSNTQEFIEKQYCSNEILNEFKLSPIDQESNQFYGGFLLLKNTSKSYNIINEWSQYICKENHKYLIPKIKPSQENGLIHHMYDQAILSCILKKNKVKSIYIGDKSHAGSIRMIRHRFGYSKFENKKIPKITYQMIEFGSRLRLAILRRILIHKIISGPKKHD